MKERAEAERDEPCLSVMEDSCLDAAFSNGLPENMIPVEERGSNEQVMDSHINHQPNLPFTQDLSVHNMKMLIVTCFFLFFFH